MASTSGIRTAPSQRRGLDALGVSVEWGVHLVPHGSVLSPAPNSLVLDVGNGCGPGMLDQHHDRSLGPSTVSLLFARPEYVYDHLVGPWLALERTQGSVQGRTAAFTITSHHEPDLDAVATMVLAMALVETGGLPPWADALRQLVETTDAGAFEVRRPVDPAPLERALHVGFKALGKLLADADPMTRLQERITFVRQGCEAVWARGLVEAPSATHPAARLLDPEHPASAAWWELDGADALRDWIRADEAAFWEEARATASLDEHWQVRDAVTGRAVAVRTAVLSRVPESYLAKEWLRQEGYVLTVIPLALDAGSGSVRVIASVPNGSGYTLRGLGRVLEEAEHERAMETGGEDRLLQPRWPEAWCTNSNPWYDGRGHDHTIVDSPSGPRFSRLGQDRIHEVIRGFAEQVARRDTGLTVVEARLIRRVSSAGVPATPPALSGSTERSRAPFLDKLLGTRALAVGEVECTRAALVSESVSNMEAIRQAAELIGWARRALLQDPSAECVLFIPPYLHKQVEEVVPGSLPGAAANAAYADVAPRTLWVSSGENLDAASEAVGHIVGLDGTLAALEARLDEISAATSAAPRKVVKHISEALLQARLEHVSALGERDTLGMACWTALADRHQVSQRLDDVQSCLERIESDQRSRAERNVELFLFGLGLLAVPDGVKAVFEVIDPPLGLPLLETWIPTAVAGALLFLAGGLGGYFISERD